MSGSRWGPMRPTEPLACAARARGHFGRPTQWVLTVEGTPLLFGMLSRAWGRHAPAYPACLMLGVTLPTTGPLWWPWPARADQISDSGRRYDFRWSSVSTRNASIGWDTGVNVTLSSGPSVGASRFVTDSYGDHSDCRNLTWPVAATLGFRHATWCAMSRPHPSPHMILQGYRQTTRCAMCSHPPDTQRPSQRHPLPHIILYESCV